MLAHSGMVTGTGSLGDVDAAPAGKHAAMAGRTALDNSVPGNAGMPGVPAGLLEQFQIRCLLNGVPVPQALAQALRRWLEAHPEDAVWQAPPDWSAAG